MECRICGSNELEGVLDLGLSPVANHLLKSGAEKETRYRLSASVCKSCGLMQIPPVLTPIELFPGDYPYFSSYSSTWLEHSKKFAEQVCSFLTLDRSSHVVELASNDGYLLQYFVSSGVKVTGVEPATGCAEVAMSKGVHTEQVFFGETTAGELLRKRGSADLVVANNVLGHVPDIKDFMAGVEKILKPNGVASFEFPHSLNLILHNQFDTIYHEHYSYLSLRPVSVLLDMYGLKCFDVEKLPTHGGSLRVYVCRSDNTLYETRQSVHALIEEEENNGMSDMSAYRAFAARVKALRDDFLSFLIEQHREGKRVVAYGAPAKGNTFLNYCGVDTGYISFTVDKNVRKQGLLLPGSLIPIYSPEVLLEERPDYIVILPWNFKDEIIGQLKGKLDWDVKFVTAVPEFSINEI
ncbi:MAG: class I SAM-dependent methyltransferase [Rhizobiaceae bacterium]